MTMRAWRFLPWLLLLFGLAAPAGADDAVPDSATIREKVRAANGSLPNAWHETATVKTSNGTSTITRHVQRGTDFREIIETAPFHSERGSLNGQAWHQNDNGQTVLEQPEPGLAARETLATTVTRVRTPVDAYVIATLNAKGYGVKDYIEPAAWRLVRREATGVNGTTVTTYDDFREDHGRTFAHHWRTENGAARVTSDGTFTDYGASDVNAADLEIPPSRRHLVEFPAGVTSAELPATFGNQHIYVRVTINGRGLDFLLDTGASGITIDGNVAKELGLPMYAEHSTVTAGRYTTARTLIKEMHVGSLTLRDVAVQAIPQGNDETNSIKVVGLLGFDFLAELGVTIDYEQKRVTVVPEAAYAAPADPHTTALNVRLGNGVPMTDVRINGALAERFVLDTGGVGTFLIFDYFARRHPEALKDEGEGRRMKPVRLRGIGGAFETQPYQIAALQLQNIRFTDFVGYRVATAGAYAGASDGLIAADFLRLFTLGLHYGESRVYLVPNRNGRAAMGIK
ncbi:MAG: hypothetical protein QOJ39_640 [Candidatus Eremiobacteraeota bacterium]|jgi:clan AA aspartic protease (TIGR02281 family)|nr:hypothetical protein [Candidatus Eremiobacteraeota bacterium]